MGAMVVLLVVSAGGFQLVTQMFFPDAARPQMMVDFWFPEGASIEETTSQMTRVEEKLKAMVKQAEVVTF